MRVSPSIEVVACPMADGGEGTLDAVLAAIGSGGRRHRMSVRGAGGSAIEAAYGLLDAPDGPTAVLEAAQVVGITDAAGMATPVGARTTRGLGELIRALLDQGVRRYMIGVGGSSTNDGGAGMLLELGLALVAADGRPIPPGPEGLSMLDGAVASALDPRLASCAITIMSDVNNPLTGERGATAIFGPQKGVLPQNLSRFDEAIARFAALAEGAIGRRATDAPGGRGGRARLRAANDRRHVCIRRQRRRRPDRTRYRARAGRLGDHRRGPQRRADAAAQGAVRGGGAGAGARRAGHAGFPAPSIPRRCRNSARISRDASDCRTARRRWNNASRTPKPCSPTAPSRSRGYCSPRGLGISSAAPQPAQAMPCASRHR